MRYSCRFLSGFLPFEHGLFVELQFQQCSNEGAGGFFLHCLERSKMLLDSVVEASELLARTVFQTVHSIDLSHMSLMDDPWSVVASFERFYGFLVLIPGVRKTYNYSLRRPILQCMAEVHQLLCARDVGALVDRYAELFPEGL